MLLVWFVFEPMNLDQAAAEHDLLAEQVGLALFLERGLDDWARLWTSLLRSPSEVASIRVLGEMKEKKY